MFAKIAVVLAIAAALPCEGQQRFLTVPFENELPARGAHRGRTAFTDADSGFATRSHNSFRTRGFRTTTPKPQFADVDFSFAPRSQGSFRTGGFQTTTPKLQFADDDVGFTARSHDSFRSSEFHATTQKPQFGDADGGFAPRSHHSFRTGGFQTTTPKLQFADADVGFAPRSHDSFRSGGFHTTTQKPQFADADGGFAPRSHNSFRTGGFRTTTSMPQFAPTESSFTGQHFQSFQRPTFRGHQTFRSSTLNQFGAPTRDNSVSNAFESSPPTHTSTFEKESQPSRHRFAPPPPFRSAHELSSSAQPISTQPATAFLAVEEPTLRTLNQQQPSVPKVPHTTFFQPIRTTTTPAPTFQQFNRISIPIPRQPITLPPVQIPKITQRPRFSEPQRFAPRTQDSNALLNTQKADRRFQDTEEKIFRQQAENAKYSFGSNIDDNINGNQHQREEVRDGVNVKGMYSYSDGYVKRTVFYEADDKGYRIVRQEEEPLGDGPQVNPKGQANVSSFVGGNALQYSITAADIQDTRSPELSPQRRF